MASCTIKIKNIEFLMMRLFKSSAIYLSIMNWKEILEKEMIILANNKKIPVINIPVNNFVNTGYQFCQYWLMILSILVIDFKGKQTKDSKIMGGLRNMSRYQINNVKNMLLNRCTTYTFRDEYTFSHSFVFHKGLTFLV